MTGNSNFADRVLAWFDDHGRKDLPWQQDPTPYRVWVSEIMLQQTQVATVIPYYQRFMGRFVTLGDLAAAPIDDVLHHWSGLGYYARARNLHRAAQLIASEHGGRFPNDLDEVMALPGIGRSTAGAILSLACGQCQSILDGNVKRVLSRHRAVEGWAGQSSVLKYLWDIAETETPWTRVADYNQAMMDLGATLCTRTRPDCDACPVMADCQARQTERVAEFPASRPKKEKPVRRTCMLMLRAPGGEVLLQRRPPTGIWGGLWSLPEIEQGDDAAEWCRSRFGVGPERVREVASMRHTFSHFHLDIQPLEICLSRVPGEVREVGDEAWFGPDERGRLGLSAPVERLLSALDAGGP